MSDPQVRGLIDTLEHRNEELVALMKEAGEFGTMQLAIEDIGWKPLLGFADSANCFTLENLQRISELCRAVATANPLVGRGLEVRAGYVWGSGVQIVPEEFIQGPGRPRSVNVTPKLPDGLEDVLTGVQAQMEIDRTASCDGNLFFLVDKRNKTVQRVPMEEITDGVSQRGNKERLMYIRRTWDDWDLEYAPTRSDLRPVTQPANLLSNGPTGTFTYRPGQPSRTGSAYQVAWYPTHHVTGSTLSSINGEDVDSSKVMVHASFNRMTGWRWGVPDVMPAVWWAKAYKEFLENSAVLTKAYARFAWKVTSDKSKTVKRAAAALAAPPARDPANGMPMGIGASAVLGAGQDLSAIQRNTSVDFDAGRPLASMIAASLGVPLPALTCDPMNGNRATAEALDTSTVLVMQARQKSMDQLLRTIFKLLGLKIRLRWPEISEEPVHRRIQAIDMGARLGVLSANETRAMVLDAWHGKWDDFPRDTPDLNQLPWALRPKPVVAVPGGGTGARLASAGSTNPPRQPDPMSRGDHELRDEGTQAHTRNS